MTTPQPEHFRIELDPADVVSEYARHRRRFASSVHDLDEAALATPSRCAEWTVADVLRHGCDVDRVIRSIWAGERPLAGFDPRLTPHEWVVEGRSVSDVDVRDRYVESAQAMATEVEGSGPDRWGLPSGSPAGRVPWWLSLLHVFYDSWVHERDVFIPLRSEPVAASDEVDTTLAYSLVLALLVQHLLGTSKPIDVVVDGFRAASADGYVTVARSDAPLGVPELTGDPALVVDAMSGRGALEDVLTGDPDAVDHLGGLARFFTTPV